MVPGPWLSETFMNQGRQWRSVRKRRFRLEAPILMEPYTQSESLLSALGPGHILETSSQSPSLSPTSSHGSAHFTDWE